jgi:hypothetical protein
MRSNTKQASTRRGPAATLKYQGSQDGAAGREATLTAGERSASSASAIGLENTLAGTYSPYTASTMQYVNLEKSFDDSLPGKEKNSKPRKAVWLLRNGFLAVSNAYITNPNDLSPWLPGRTQWL